jgi:hypothetical protein
MRSAVCTWIDPHAPLITTKRYDEWVQSVNSHNSPNCVASNISNRKAKNSCLARKGRCLISDSIILDVCFGGQWKVGSINGVVCGKNFI